MTRRALREQIFKIIFRAEFNSPGEMTEQIDFSVGDIEKLSEEDEAYIVDKSDKILAKLDVLDEEIAKISDGWNIGGIGKAELAILRVAIFEMLYDDDVPYKVAINEAVELAKIYCNEDARSFINGLLAKVTVE